MRNVLHQMRRWHSLCPRKQWGLPPTPLNRYDGENMDRFIEANEGLFRRINDTSVVHNFHPRCSYASWS